MEEAHLGLKMGWTALGRATRNAALSMSVLGLLLAFLIDELISQNP